MAGIVAAQQQAQPFVYPSGLIEVPMSPISDVTAFRTGRWPLEAFLEAIRAGVAWAIEQQAVFCFLGHPSCLVVADPAVPDDRRDLRPGARRQAKRAALVDLGTIASRADQKART